MSYQVLVGQRKALVFPVMCYGYLRVDYSDEVALTDYGLFNHSGPITIQAMVTPYDVNGFGYTLDLDNPIGKMGVTNSKKTMPAKQSKAFTLDNYSGAAVTITDTYSQRAQYLSSANALTHEMMLFYNTNIQLSLLNATTTNMNQPAEYKIKFTINANGTSDTLTTTDTVINANDVTTNYHVSHGLILRVVGLDIYYWVKLPLFQLQQPLQLLLLKMKFLMLEINCILKVGKHLHILLR